MYSFESKWCTAIIELQNVYCKKIQTIHNTTAGNHKMLQYCTMFTQFSHEDFKITPTEEETVCCPEPAHTYRLKDSQMSLSCHLMLEMSNTFICLYVFENHHSDDDWQSW